MVSRNRAVLLALLAALSSAVTSTEALRSQEVVFLRGDVNSDGAISISDSLMMRRWLFNGDRPPSCAHAADFDDNGRINITDQLMIIGFAFLGGEPPAPPFPEIGADTTPNEYRFGCEYEPTPPVKTEDLIRIGDVQGTPGEIAFVPVWVRNAVEIEAFQIVLEYDETKLEPLTQRWDTRAALEGTAYEEIGLQTPYFGGIPVKAGVLVFGFIPSLVTTGFELPASDEEVLAFRIPILVHEDAEPGTVALTPTNGRNELGAGPALLRNELTNRGDARFVSTLPKTEGGFMQIVPDQTFFLRGDANDDDILNLSDAQFTLSHLFLGTPQAPCADAADANDDGRIDLADPISTLWYLFSGGPALPPPSAEPGLDPTTDRLRCGKP